MRQLRNIFCVLLFAFCGLIAWMTISEQDSLTHLIKDNDVLPKLSNWKDVKLYQGADSACTPRFAALYNRPINSSIVDEIERQQSSRKVRIFCMILTSESNWMTKRMAVKLTWAGRCDNYCFFYTPDKKHGIRNESHACAVKTPDGHGKLTPKVLEAFNYTRSVYKGTYDWVIKADDDTYVIMENLKAFLSNYKPTEPHFFGHLLRNELKTVPHGHLSGGAGYVLSSKTLDVLLTNSECQFIWQEDLHVACCLSQLKIYPENTKDEEGLNRFHSEDLIQMLSRTDWPYDYRKGNFTVTKGDDGILSSSAISFHHLTYQQIYTYDYLIYGLKKKIQL